MQPAGTDIFSLMKFGNYLALEQELLAKGDHIYGSDRSDTILGFGGKDFLYGNAGSDILEGSTGADALNGGAGANKAQYAHAGSGVVVDLRSPNHNKGEATAAPALSSIEVLTGTPFSDKLSGDDNANSIGGGSGGNDRAFRPGRKRHAPHAWWRRLA